MPVNENLIPIVIVPVVFGSIVWMTYLVINALLTWHRRRLSAQFHEKLLERFGSSRDFGEFLNTEGGRSFVDSLLVEKSVPHQRIMHALQWGIIVVLFGMSLLIIRGPIVARGLPPEINPVLMFFGTVAVFVGLGLLVSSGATFVLSKRMGLLESIEQRHTPAGSLKPQA
jgi:hypothetical protein